MSVGASRLWNMRSFHCPLLFNDEGYNNNDSKLFWNTLLFPRIVFLSPAMIHNRNLFPHFVAVRVKFFSE